MGDSPILWSYGVHTNVLKLINLSLSSHNDCTTQWEDPRIQMALNQAPMAETTGSSAVNIFNNTSLTSSQTPSGKFF